MDVSAGTLHNSEMLVTATINMQKSQSNTRIFCLVGFFPKATDFLKLQMKPWRPALRI